MAWGARNLISAQAIALTIEMGFLSLTFAASLKKQKHSVFLVSILLPPLSLWLGGFIGATTAAAVARAPAMHVALISFGIAALLFLVTEELLLEAHEAVSKIAAAETLVFGSMAWRVTEVPRAGTRPRSTPRTRSTSGGSTCSSSSAFY